MVWQPLTHHSNLSGGSAEAKNVPTPAKLKNPIRVESGSPHRILLEHHPPQTLVKGAIGNPAMYLGSLPNKASKQPWRRDHQSLRSIYSSVDPERHQPRPISPDLQSRNSVEQGVSRRLCLHIFHKATSILSHILSDSQTYTAGNKSGQWDVTQQRCFPPDRQPYER